MPIKNLLKKIRDKNQRDIVKRLSSLYGADEFNFEVDNGVIVGFSLKFKDLHRIPPEISVLYNLKRLDLSNNKIAHIEHLDSLILLEELTLRENEIREIEGLTNLKNLRKLDLSDNHIFEIGGLYALENLEELNLSRNKIRKIEGLDNLNRLVKLVLSGNPIVRIENLDKLQSLRILLISKAFIVKIEGLDKLINLRELDLASNNIRKIEGLENNLLLTRLNLNNNQIREIDNIGHLKYLKEFKIKFNPLNPDDMPYIDAPINKVMEWLKEKERRKIIRELKKKEEKERIRKEVEEELSEKTVIYRFSKDKGSSEADTLNIGDGFMAPEPFDISGIWMDFPDNEATKNNLENSSPADSAVKKPIPESELNPKGEKNIMDKENHSIEPDIKGKSPSAIEDTGSKGKIAPPAWLVGAQFVKKKRIKSAVNDAVDDNSPNHTDSREDIPANSKIKREIPSSGKKNKEIRIRNAEVSQGGEDNGKEKEIDQELIQWLQSARESMRNSDELGALRAYSKVLKKDPKNVEAWLNSGILLNNLEKYREARALLESFLKKYPDNADGWYYLGIVLFNMGEFFSSLDAFDELISLNPDDRRYLTFYRRIPGNIVLLHKFRKETGLSLDEKLKFLERALIEVFSRDQPDVALLRRYFNEFTGIYEEMPSIEISDIFIVQNLIAFTKTSRIWNVVFPKNRRSYVLKHVIIGDENDEGKNQLLASVFREVLIGYYLNFHNLMHVEPLYHFFIGTDSSEKGCVLIYPANSIESLQEKIKKIISKSKHPNVDGELSPWFTPEFIKNLSIGMFESLLEFRKVGLIHSDISPANIMLDANSAVPDASSVKIIDFGLADIFSVFDGASILKASFKGTPGFSAPEKFDENIPINPNTDIYDAAAVLYFILTGRKYDGKFEIPDGVIEYYRDLDFIFPVLKRMLDADPARRLKDDKELERIISDLRNCRKMH